MEPPPVFVPGEFHGQRSPAGYSPWGCKESDVTEHTHRDAKMEKEFKTKVNMENQETPHRRQAETPNLHLRS